MSGSDDQQGAATTLSYGPHSRSVHGMLAFFLAMFFCSMMVISVWDLSDERRGPLLELLAWVAAPYSLFCLFRYVIFLRQHWTEVVSVTPDGLHDVRATRTRVPWDAIEAMVLQRETNRMDILVALAPDRLRAEYGKPAWVPSFRRKLRLPETTFSIGSGLERNPAGIANDINAYRYKPKALLVTKA